MKISWFPVVALGLPVILSLVLAWCSVAAGRRRRRGAPHPAEGVSILKPLKGVDPDLEENLATFFRQDHPDHEILLGAADPDDPALEVAARVAAAHPGVRCRIVHGEADVGGNPKVRNLAHLLRHARHDVLWIADSNTAVGSGHLSDMAARLADPGVGLVVSPVAATGGEGIGAALEALQVNGFLRGGMEALPRCGGVCVVGKSMLLRRRDLARIGGFRHLARFAAEDQVCGEEMRRRGLRIVAGALSVHNRLGPIDLRGFAARHLRWAHLRRRMAPAGYAGEILLQPVAAAAAWTALSPSPASAAALAGAWLLRAALDARMERSLGRRRPWTTYALLSPLRDLLVTMLWPLPFLRTTRIRWRGNHLRIGPRTVILPADAPIPAGPARPAPGPVRTEPRTIPEPWPS